LIFWFFYIKTKERKTSNILKEVHEKYPVDKGHQKPQT